MNTLRKNSQPHTPSAAQVLVSRTARTWFALTPAEHRAVVLILGLFLLGIAVRLYLVW
jgi:hypothetical protein